MSGHRASALLRSGAHTSTQPFGFPPAAITNVRYLRTFSDSVAAESFGMSFAADLNAHLTEGRADLNFEFIN
jgi:hypothetical protein